MKGQKLELLPFQHFEQNKTFQGGEYVDTNRIGWFVVYGKIKLQTECEYVEKIQPDSVLSPEFKGKREISKGIRNRGRNMTSQKDSAWIARKS